ncbi:hypothetical protein [Spirosoma fluminis]
MSRLFVLFLALLVSTCCLGASADSTQQRRFQKLSDEMRIKKLRLKENDYEVRIWNKQSLAYGDAQTLYRLVKRREKLTVSKYSIWWNKYEFKQATERKSVRPATMELWQKLVEHDMLTLPDMAALHDQLFPSPQPDSAWNVIEADGTVSVKAKIRRSKQVIIGDGEGYYFQVFGQNRYHDYEYGNPYIYIKYRPEIVELSKVVAILNDIAQLFTR